MEFLDALEAYGYVVFIYELEDDDRFHLVFSNQLDRELRHSKEEVHGELLAELFDAKSAELIDERMRAALRKRNTVKCFHTRLSDEDPALWEVTMIPCVEADKKMVYGLAKRAQFVEDGAFDEKKSFGSLYDGVNAALAVVERDGGQTMVCQGCNQMFARLMGLSVDEAIGMPLERLFSGGIQLTAYASACIETKRSFSYRAEEILQSGESVLEISITPLLKDGRTLAVLNLTDVTEMVLAKRQAKKLDEEYQCVFQSSANGIALFRCRGDGFEVERENAAFRKLFGSRRRHRVYAELFAWLRRVHDSQEQKEFELQAGTETKKQLFLSVSAVPILNGEEAEKIFVTAVNTTEKMQLQKRMEGALTKRENEVLALAAEGFPNKYIACRLGVTEGTVKRQIYNGYRKLGICSRAELVKFYLSDRHIEIM